MPASESSNFLGRGLLRMARETYPLAMICSPSILLMEASWEDEILPELSASLSSWMSLFWAAFCCTSRSSWLPYMISVSMWSESPGESSPSEAKQGSENQQMPSHLPFASLLTWNLPRLLKELGSAAARLSMGLPALGSEETENLLDLEGSRERGSWSTKSMGWVYLAGPKQRVSGASHGTYSQRVSRDFQTS